MREYGISKADFNARVTFITMQSLTQDADLLFCSDSVTDVLGYDPPDLVGRSLFSLIHPEEKSNMAANWYAALLTDSASVLVYCRLQTKQMGYVRCECVFTVVYDVTVAAITLHLTQHAEERRRAARRAREEFASVIDPRYSMITQLSSKFTVQRQHHEPRVALILNRYSRSLPIMYGTHACHTLLGIDSNNIQGCSFYNCIDGSSLQEAIRVIEHAKTHNAIAYLEFLFKQPTPSNAAEVSGNDDEGSLFTANARVKVECVVSCTTDGLVAVIRHAPQRTFRHDTTQFYAPWPVPISINAAAAAAMTTPSASTSPPDVLQTVVELSAFAWSVENINADVARQVQRGT